MKSKLIPLMIVTLAFPGLTMMESARAEEKAPETQTKDTAGESKAGKKKNVKGRRRGEKETEGTEAPDRFEADTVIKSRYQLNGEPLEVDPD